jgi:hypothetical protein
MPRFQNTPRVRMRGVYPTPDTCGRILAFASNVMYYIYN